MVYCTYTLLEGRIHHFLLLENSTKAVAELVSIYEATTIQHQQDFPGEEIRVMMEFGKKGTPPIMYAEKLYKDMMRRHPQLPKERIVYLHQFGTMMSIVTLVMPLFPGASKVTRKFYSREHKDEAITWLLSDSD